MRFVAVVRTASDGSYWSEVPALPGCVSQGATVESTVANTRGAIQVWLTYLRDKGRPDPDADAQAVIIDVDV
jgi:predicted RNase H-like HicB family nuclease